MTTPTLEGGRGIGAGGGGSNPGVVCGVPGVDDGTTLACSSTLLKRVKERRCGGNGAGGAGGGGNGVEGRTSTAQAAGLETPGGGGGGGGGGGKACATRAVAGPTISGRMGRCSSSSESRSSIGLVGEPAWPQSCTLANEVSNTAGEV